MTEAERLVLILTAELMMMTNGYAPLHVVEAKRKELAVAVHKMRAERETETHAAEGAFW
jgi:hypothetical protein